ncbi:mucin-19 [Anopheles darlingi]|uniref:mucin-19 n=1 Tax=Anopheles darlingi TaxID=43151 RepID=UPI0021003933|nr:mucin-19 [Anopheles darlingi]
MRRYPTEQPAAINVDPINFYPPANTNHQRIAKSSDKSKKTWGQRLKLSKPTTPEEKPSGSLGSPGTGTALVPIGGGHHRQTTPQHGYESVDFSHASVSSGHTPSSIASNGHTMKYAETWVYGTVRGMPPPLQLSHPPHHPTHHLPHLAHLPAIYCPPPEMAVLICCCPEYLSGTKRDIKKASVCKKCKGSRLPLAPIGGTVRLTSGATYLAPPPVRSSAGTVKLASSYGNKKARPSILGNGNPDPYDFMRRSRLTQSSEVSGAPGSGSKSVKTSLKEKFRGRTKSTSPSRGKRGSARSPSPLTGKGRTGGSSGTGTNKQLSSFQDCWVDSERDDPLPDELPGTVSSASQTSASPNRKSILRCDVNPYDLISLSGGGGGGGSGGQGLLNEFSPHDTGDGEFDLHAQKYENILDTLYANRYNPAHPVNNIAAINGQRIKLFDDARPPTVYDDVEEYVYDPIELAPATGEENGEPLSAAAAVDAEGHSTPERPPRTKKQQLPSTVGETTGTKEDDGRSLPSQLSVGTESGMQSAIKSILKRPPSGAVGPTPANSVLSEHGRSTDPAGNAGPGYDTIRLNHTLVQRLAKLTTAATAEDSNSFGKSGTVSARHMTVKANGDKRGSQFYLPTPFTDGESMGAAEGSVTTTTTTVAARKKVHFLVENEVIDDDKLFAQMLFTDTVVTVNGGTAASGDAEGSQAGAGTTALKAAYGGERSEKPAMAAMARPVDGGETPRSGLPTARVVGVVNLSKSNGSDNDVSLVNGVVEHTKPRAVATVFQHSSGPVHRSFSDRGASPTKASAVMAAEERPPVDHFIDTMALRVRPIRASSRVAFEEETASSTSGSSSTSSSDSSFGSVASLLVVSSGNGSKVRPKVPPPPPPPPPPGTMTSGKPSAATTGSPQQQQQQQQQASAVSEGRECDVYEDFCFSLISATGVRRSSSDRSSSTSTSSRTVLQMGTSSPSPIATGGSISTSGAVHRLEIRHDPEPDEEQYQKMTSILITGDDCYSTVNVDGASDTTIYQSSVVVNDAVTTLSVSPTEIRQTASNTITISVSSPTSTLQSRGNKMTITGAIPLEDDALIASNNERNLSYHGVGTRALPGDSPSSVSVNTSGTSIIPIGNGSNPGSPTGTLTNGGRTLINLDYTPQRDAPEMQKKKKAHEEPPMATTVTAPVPCSNDSKETVEVQRVQAAVQESQESSVTPPTTTMVKRVHSALSCAELTPVVLRRTLKPSTEPASTSLQAKVCRNSFIAKLLEDPTLNQLAEGLEYELIAKLIENSLLRLKESRNGLDLSGTKDEDDVSRLIEQSLLKIQEERSKLGVASGATATSTSPAPAKSTEDASKRSSVSSGNSYGSAAAYELMEFDQLADLSDCYQSCSSDLTVDDETTSSRSKFYQMLVDATLSEIEINTTNDEDEDDHHYESIRLNGDPIYEEINEIPPPLPLTAPPIDDLDLEKQRNARSIFEGASKYDILSYLVDAKERGIAQDVETYAFQFGSASDIILEEEESEPIADLRHHQRQISDISSRLSNMSGISDSSEDASLSTTTSGVVTTNGIGVGQRPKASAEIERNDSGVGSETSKTSRSRWQHPMPGSASLLNKIAPIHLCEDCDGPVETQVTESGVMYAPLVCRKCGKKRAERKEIITEIVETEEKYGRDLQIILEEFYQPMLVAGLLNQDQLSAIFLNVEELLENNQFLAERMRDALDIATEQGDDDLLTVNIGRIFLEAAPMLHAFESYCVRQGAASLLLANLEKEKELLRIFLRVSQMENAVLRRMNLNSFLMVPVQRVTKYPLLLARLYKVTPGHLEGKELLKQSQEKIELHLNHMNREAKDVPTKLWRRISSSSPGRRLSCELDMINIKLRKMAVDVLEWNHEEVRFAIEGRLLFTQPNDGNWKKSRTIKLTSINALLVTNGKPTASYKADRALTETLSFPRHTGIREASLLLVREKGGRYTLLREPLFLDRCVVCSEHDWEDYFEVQEILSKESFIFKAEDGTKTKQWYAQLQYHSQGMGTWRKRRNALANIMINGMMTRT